MPTTSRRHLFSDGRLPSRLRSGGIARPLVVEGLAELRRDLRRAQDLEGTAELRDGLRDAAGIVAAEAKLRANSFSFRVSDTIRPLVRGTRAYVAGGKAILPWYGWADFGSRSPVIGNPRSRGPWHKSGKGPEGGRFIYPAIEAKQSEVVVAVERATGRALRRFNFDIDVA